MLYTYEYNSPLGKLTAAADSSSLVGLWFENHKYFSQGLSCKNTETDILRSVRKWLDMYFSGKEPDFMPPISFTGTDFQIMVWNLLLEIPYGQTVTYGELARRIAAMQNKERMSAQAVGNAVGRNKIAIIVPCHRVIGADGSLTGYAGGIDLKRQLLMLESQRK